ncbi:MAG: peptidoglycan editing factor PgeF [Candidatus Woykebacteria bacterium]
MIKLDRGFYTFKTFSLYPKLLGIVTTKLAGNFKSLKNNDTRPLFILEQLGIDHRKVVQAQQIHSGNVAWAHDYNAASTMQGYDGLITSERNLFLTVLVADCVPILFFDPVQNFIAVAHSGWRGALQKISLAVAEEFTKFGSNKENILVAAGPSIGNCHYDIDSSRAQLFDLSFGKDKVTREEKGKIYLDLVAAATNPLLEFGIPEKNIEVSGVCTAESSEFYSYRREKESGGRFAAIIGMKNE